MESYLDECAVAVPRGFCVKVVMVVDICKAADHGLQGLAVLLNLSHARDQALGHGSVGQFTGSRQSSYVVLTGFLQGRKHNPEVHVWGCEKDRREEEDT